MTRSLKQVERSKHIDFRVVHRICDRMAHIDLGREMEHRVRLECTNQVYDLRGRHVDLVCDHRAALPGVLEVRKGTGAEIVDDEHLVTVVDESINKLRSDASGPPPDY